MEYDFRIVFRFEGLNEGEEEAIVLIDAGTHDEVYFDVDKEGNVTNVRLRESSGNPDIDRKAEEALRRRRDEASESLRTSC